MVDSVINVLIEKLIESLLDKASHVLEFHKQFKTINKELELMQSYIKQAEKVRRNQNEILKTVVRQLRELLYDVEDIISDCELFLKSESRKRAPKFKRCISPSVLKFRYKMGKKLGHINQEIRSHRKMMRTYLTTNHILPSQERLANNRPPVLINSATEIVGLDDSAKKIKQWILNTHGLMNIIGIVGMGGIGKTTLAQKMHNDGDVKNYFDHILMVTVSQNFKFEESIKNMLKKISGPRDLTNIDRFDLLKELQDQLDGKQCLIILDDVWRLDHEVLWWDSLKSVLPQKSCCVIITTRNGDVARSMGVTELRTLRPQLLSDADSWSLFSRVAFVRDGGRCSDPEIEVIGREIVGRCGGLPLAIKVVAGMMMSKGSSINEWRRISENLKEELNKKGEPIFSVLELSYDELPSHLKPCMLCFAAFPEDYEITQWQIIPWWIGEGFVRGRATFDLGREYIDELISQCLLLLDIEEFLGGKLYWFKLHDMVHEMIRRIAKEENFICIEDGGGQSSCIQSRRVGMMPNSDMNLFSEEINLKSLRTVAGFDLRECNRFAQNMGSKLCQLKQLRVLNISFQESSESPSVDWLSGIGSLRHLICLTIDYSRLERLPDSIGELQNLQFLILTCSNLKRLPKNIASLENLSILVLSRNRSLEFLPMEIANLRQLSRFSFSINSTVKDGFQISSLKKLNQLRELGLTITSEDVIKEGELKVLSELTQLELLIIRFSFPCNDDELLSKKFDHELSPLQQLSELYIVQYPGERPPAWLNPTSFPNLLQLHLNASNITHMNLEFFGRNKGVWKLEVLILKDLPELEEDWPRMQEVLPHLKLLKVINCPQLKSPPFKLDEDGIGIWKRTEESMYVVLCNKLFIKSIYL